MQDADHILVPLLDGRHGLAQVARIEQGRALILLTQQVSTPDAVVTALREGAVIASVIVAPDALTSGQWPVIGYDAVPSIKRYREISLPLADPIDPAIAEALVNAIHGLFPWDGFPDPAFFEGFMRDAAFQPTLARMTTDFPKPDGTA